MRVLGLVLCSLLVATAAGAASVNHGDFVGVDVKFLDVTETTQTAGDPDVLWGAPTLSGDQLLFFPAAFSASATGAGGADSTASQLQILLEAKPNQTLEQIMLTEFGDAVLSGSGTSATNAAISLSGFVTVLEDASGVIVPVVIPFVGTIAPGSPLALPGDVGTTIWSGSVLIDIASVVPNATKAMFSLDNQLDAFSESGSSAFVQKKVVSGPAISLAIIPEPATAVLLGMGLVGLAVQGRRKRV